MSADKNPVGLKLAFFDRLTRDPNLKPLEKVIAWRLLQYVNEQYGYAWPSPDTVAAEAGCDERTVRKAIKRLCDEGWFLILAGGGGRAKTNRYLPNLERRAATPPFTEEKEGRCAPLSVPAGEKRGAAGTEKGGQAAQKGGPGDPPISLTESLKESSYQPHACASEEGASSKLPAAMLGTADQRRVAWLGEQLRTARTKLGWTEGKLGSRLSPQLSKYRVKQIEAGTAPLTDAEVEAIALSLDMLEDELEVSRALPTTEQAAPPVIARQELVAAPSPITPAQAAANAKRFRDMAAQVHQAKGAQDRYRDQHADDGAVMVEIARRLEPHVSFDTAFRLFSAMDGGDLDKLVAEQRRGVLSQHRIHAEMRKVQDTLKAVKQDARMAHAMQGAHA